MFFSFQVGKFYELYNMDATVGVKELGLIYMKVFTNHKWSDFDMEAFFIEGLQVTGCLLYKKHFNSHEWPSQNFSLQCQYNVKHASDENKEKYQLCDYQLILHQILWTNYIRSV